MKRFLAIIISVVMCLTCCAYADDSEGIRFDPSFTSSLNLSTDEWFDNEVYRSMLAICITFDLCSAGVVDNDELMMTQSAVGYISETDSLTIAVWGDEKAAFVVYNPLLSYGKAILTDVSSPTQAKYMAEAILESVADRYFINSPETVLDVMNMILDIIQKNK